jgi:hypothetical protein
MFERCISDGYRLNRHVNAFFKVLLTCVFQFKRVSRCQPIYFTGVSLGVQVMYALLIEMLGMFWCNLRRANKILTKSRIFYCVETISRN